MKILNVGCGNRILPDAINLDRTKHRPEVDVAHDLNVLPWPFEDETFDKVVALAVLEHLPMTLFESFAEIWRILKFGGQLVVKLPLHTGHNAYDDPSHYWLFSLRSLDQFCPETQRGKDYEFYTPYKWRFIKPPAPNKAETSLWATLEKIQWPPVE
jgi:ubiquinone/menaquinone biosynthesis C-methylase UbiE